MVFRNLGPWNHSVDWLPWIQPQFQNPLLGYYFLETPKVVQVLISSEVMMWFWNRTISSYNNCLYFAQLPRYSSLFGNISSTSLPTLSFMLNAREDAASIGMFKPPLLCCCFSSLRWQPLCHHWTSRSNFSCCRFVSDCHSSRTFASTVCYFQTDITALLCFPSSLPWNCLFAIFLPLRFAPFPFTYQLILLFSSISSEPNPLECLRYGMQFLLKIYFEACANPFE